MRKRGTMDQRFCIQENGITLVLVRLYFYSYLATKRFPDPLLSEIVTSEIQQKILSRCSCEYFAFTSNSKRTNGIRLLR